MDYFNENFVKLTEKESDVFLKSNPSIILKQKSDFGYIPMHLYKFKGAIFIVETDLLGRCLIVPLNDNYGNI